VIRAMVVASIPMLQLAGHLAVWHLYAAAFALALATLAFDIASTAVIPELAEGELTRANAAHQMVGQIASMAGPAVAGMVVGSLGGFRVLWLDSVSFAGTFVALVFMPSIGKVVAKSGQSLIKGISEGFSWLWQSRVIRALALQAMTGNFGFGMVSAVLMYYMRATLRLDAQVIGVNYAMLGVGGLAGSLVTTPLSRRFRRNRLYPAILGFGFSGLIVMASVRLPWGPGLGFGMVAACNVAWVVLSTSVRQELIPKQMMGRVLSFSRILSTTAMPVGASLGGLLSKSFDPSFAFLCAAACKLVETAIARLSAMRDL